MMDILGRSAIAIAGLIRNRELSALDVMAQTLRQAERVQRALNPFVTIAWDQAIEQAKRCDQLLLKGSPADEAYLFGVPFTAKDLLNTCDLRTTYGSRAFETFQPQADVVAIDRLRKAGAVLIGKTTTPEFASQLLTDSELTGITRNPWDPTRSPGGSSGGAGVAVATGVGAFGISTDGGGSARVPAAACGILGLKVTLGAIPHETWPFHFGNNSSISINSRHVEDLVLGFNLMKGASTLDPWSRRRIAPLSQPEPSQAKGPKKRALFIPALGGQVADQNIMAVVQPSLKALQQAGYEISTAEDDPVAFDRGLSLELMAANLAARVRAMQPEQQASLSAPLKALLSNETFKSDGVRLQAQAIERSALYDRLEHTLNQYSLILTPTLNAQAPLADPSRDQRVCINDAWLPLPAWWSHLSIANLTGHPALSVPCGWDADGLPVGLHAIAGWDREQDLVDLAASVALHNDWTGHYPSIAS
jgi:aspartyl-tRNA(Asn)/glutamyl-tRNA(Gln) amidotransferase subunit A